MYQKRLIKMRSVPRTLKRDRCSLSCLISPNRTIAHVLFITISDHPQGVAARVRHGHHFLPQQRWGVASEWLSSRH